MTKNESGEAMTKPADSKQAIPSPEDRVRAEMVEKARKFLASPWARTYEESSEEWALTDFALSLVEELKGQEASASQQPTCPEHKIEMVQKVDRKVPFWGCPNDGCGLFISVELLNQVAQFFPAASAPEAALLRKRKDYHAEYVEAVEAAEKAERELAIEKTMLPKWEGLLDVHERLSESLVRQLEVTREALRKIEDPGAKVDSLMEARMIARAALTPEPATKAEVKK